MTKCDKCKDPDYLETIFEHCQLDPETQAWERRVAYFFKANPKIVGLSYTAADVLRLEKNLKIRNAAISIIHEEIGVHRNIESNNYSLIRRKVSAERVRGIVNEQRILIEGTDIQREKLVKQKAEEVVKDKEVLYTCPLCQGLITVTLSKRDKIVSLRATEAADDAYAYLAKRFDVSRSFLLSELLTIESKFPEIFL